MLASLEALARDARDRWQDWTGAALPPGLTLDAVPLILLVLAVLAHGGVYGLACALLALLALSSIVSSNRLAMLKALAQPLVGQREVLQTRQAALCEALRDVTQLESNVAALEAGVAAGEALRARAKRQAAAAATQTMRLSAQVARLRSQGRAMDRLRWANRVLKAELRAGAHVLVEHKRLLAQRAELQAATQAAGALRAEVGAEREALSPKQGVAQGSGTGRPQPAQSTSSTSGASSGFFTPGLPATTPLGDGFAFTPGPEAAQLAAALSNADVHARAAAAGVAVAVVGRAAGPALAKQQRVL